ncbi:hypothetical protein Tco_0984594 [Tanacetum coccineum]
MIFFAQYAQSDIHVNENVRDDNDGDVEVAQPIGSEADQQYMINLRDDIATQIMQASFHLRRQQSKSITLQTCIAGILGSVRIPLHLHTAAFSHWRGIGENPFTLG